MKQIIFNLKSKIIYYGSKLVYVLLIGFLTTINAYPQDIITLKNSKERLEVEIISKEKKDIKFYNWNDRGGEKHELNRKFIAWDRPELWTKKRFSFSFSLGISPYGTSTSLKKYMNENGYGGSVASWFGGSIKYPKSSIKLPCMIEIEYNFKPPNGISIAYANTNSGLVEGLYPAPEVEFNNPQILFYYKYYMPTYRSNFQIGLIVNFSKITIDDSSYMDPYNLSKSSKTSPGLLIGYAGSIIEKNVFFLRIECQFKYVPPLEVDGLDGFMINEKVSLSNLFLGIKTGIKLYSDK